MAMICKKNGMMKAVINPNKENTNDVKDNRLKF